MSQAVETSESQESAIQPAFKCAVTPDNSSAKLKIGVRRIDARLVAISRTGFTVELPTKLARTISPASICELSFGSEVWAVRKESFSNVGNSSHVYFDRIREKTKIKVPRASFDYLLPKYDPRADPELLLFLTLALIVSVISLPGIGDQLGTAPKVRKGVNAVWNEVTRFF